VKNIDPDGRWVTSIFLQGSIGVGVGYGLYATQQSGIAYDRHGTTHYQMTGVSHIILSFRIYPSLNAKMGLLVAWI